MLSLMYVIRCALNTMKRNSERIPFVQWRSRPNCLSNLRHTHDGNHQGRFGRSSPSPEIEREAVVVDRNRSGAKSTSYSLQHVREESHRRSGLSRPSSSPSLERESRSFHRRDDGPNSRPRPRDDLAKPVDDSNETYGRHSESTERRKENFNFRNSRLDQDQGETDQAQRQSENDKVSDSYSTDFSCKNGRPAPVSVSQMQGDQNSKYGRAAFRDTHSYPNFTSRNHERPRTVRYHLRSSVGTSTNAVAEIPQLEDWDDDILQNNSKNELRDSMYSSPDQLGRKWTPKELPREMSSLGDGFNFTVLSYNILADKLLKDNGHLYRGYEKWLLEWDYRKENLMKEILCYNADILCLQEVQEDHYWDWLLPRLRDAGYNSIYKKRLGEKPDGCAIFYREDRFKLLSHHSVEFSRPDIPLTNRDNVALIAVLKPRKSRDEGKPPICVANTHLLFNKNRGDIKLVQLAYLFAELDRIGKVGFSRREKRAKKSRKIRAKKSADAQANNLYLPMIVCGDFNSTPFSHLHSFVTSSRLKFEGLSRVHISGQNSKSKHTPPNTFFESSFLPDGLNMSHNCKWIPATENIKDTVTSETSEAGKAQDRKRRRHCVSECAFEQETESLNSSSSDTASESEYYDSSAERIENSDDVVIMDVKEGSKSQVRTSHDEEPGVLKHSLNLKSSYKHYLKDGRAEVSTCHEQSSCTVDYIFYSPGRPEYISVQDEEAEEGEISEVFPREQLYLTGTLSLLGDKEIRAMNKLPNAYLSSDHLSLMASFKLFE